MSSRILQERPTTCPGLVIDEKLGLLNSRVSQIRPRLLRLAGGNTLDIDLYRETVGRLQGIQALTQAILD